MVYCPVPRGPTAEGLPVFITERTVAPGWQAPASVVLRTSRSRNTAESIPRSPTSKMERYRAWAPGVIGVDALKRGGAPSYVVPAPLPAVMLVAPAALTLITLFEGSKAKLSGAVIVGPLVVHVELSSSAMKASLKGLPTYSGNSSERNRKSIDRQLARGGTSRSISRIATSPC